ncbi:MAG: hypothetical protein R3F65_06170 [bacterium]
MAVSRTWRHYLRAVFVLSMLTACGQSQGCGGCDEQGAAAPFPNKDKVHSAVQVRITRPGVDFLEQNLEPLLAEVLPEEGLAFCLPGDGGNVIGIEWGYCQAEACPEGGQGCNINIAIEGIDLQAREPDQIRAVVTFAELGLRLPLQVDPIANCSLALAGPGFEVAVPLTLSTPEPTRELTFALASVPEYQLSALDIELINNGGFLGWVCDAVNGVINFPFIGDFILDSVQGLVDGLLLDQIAGLLEGFTCRSCVDDRECTGAAAGSACVEGVCRNGDGTCVQAPLGVEGVLDLGGLLAGVSPGLEASMAYHAVPGSYVAVEDGGISLGLISGATSERNRCVPNLPQPEVYEPLRTPWMRGNLDPANRPYEVGIGVTQEIIGHFAWAAFNSGLLCIEVTTDTVEQLNASTLGIALPNLSTLARSRTAPIGLTLSPQAVPRVRIGANTFVDDGEGNMVLDDPLLTIELDDLWIDFHVFMDDRWVRIFSLHTDVALPFGVQFDADNGLIPVLGDIADGLGGISTDNGEIMQDSPALIAGLLPVILNVFVGDLAGSLAEPIALPDIMGFTLDLQDGAITGIEENTMLAIFAGLRRTEVEGDAPGGGATFAVDTIAELVETGIPPTEAFAIDGPDTWRRPFARLLLDAVDGTDDGAPMEFSWKVDHGTWSAFSPAREVVVRHPLFALQGKHRVSVRARRAGDYRTLDPEPAEVVVIIDSEAPSLGLREDGAGWRAVVDDAVSGAAGVRLAVRRDGGAWAPVEGDFVALGDAAESVEVRASDEAGNTAEMRLGVRRSNLIGRLPPGAAAEGGCDCAVGAGGPSGGGGAAWWLAGLLLLGFRQRRALATLGMALLVVGVSAGLMGCEDDANTGKDPGEGDTGVRTECDDERPCPAGEACEDGVCVAADCRADPSICEGLDCGGRGSLCDDGVCACQPFCPGGCGEGEFCCELRNACEAPPAAVCGDVECGPGYEAAVIGEGTVDGARCARVDVQCGCVEVDPLDPGFVGRFVDLAVVDGTAWISAYAEDYGDLVVARYDEVAGWVWQWVDGVPAGGAVTGAPSGPRGGVEADGPNVGQYSSIAAAADGTLHVAYRDVDESALKYARGTPRAGGASHTWKTMTLDTDDAGRWAAISLGPDGVPAIAYRVGSVAEGEGAVSQLRFIMARSATPEAPADWQAPLVVHSRALAEANPETGNYPEGTGLFNSVARDPEGRPVVAWYDRSEGRLWWSRMVDAGFTEPEMLAGWGHPDPDRDGDMGANVDLFIDGTGQAHLCYQDGMTDSLRYLAPELDRDEWVDDGVWLDTGGRSYAVHVVGDDCNVRLDGDGNPVIVFQDATLQALLMRRRNREVLDPAENPWAGREVLRGDEANYQGAHGFYAAAEVVGGELWVVHYVYNNQIRPAVRRIELVKEPL